MSKSKSAPTQMPPALDGATLLRDSEPTQLVPQDSNVQGASAAAAMPTMEPPAELRAGTQEGGVMAWLSDKRVNGLWSKAENRNSWVGVTGVGWKKLSTATDSGIMALTLLSATARLTNGRYDYREEADNMIHECYIW